MMLILQVTSRGALSSSNIIFVRPFRYNRSSESVLIILKLLDSDSVVICRTMHQVVAVSYSLKLPSLKVGCSITDQRLRKQASRSINYCCAKLYKRFHYSNQVSVPNSSAASAQLRATPDPRRGTVFGWSCRNA